VKAKSKGKRSASGIVDYAPRGAQSHMQKAPRGVIAATVQSRQTVEDFITSFVGLDVHKDSIAMAVAEAGRDEPRFLGTVSPQGTALHKALAKLGKPAALMIVYEAGPSGLPRASCGRLAARPGRQPALDLNPQDRNPRPDGGQRGFANRWSDQPAASHQAGCGASAFWIAYRRTAMLAGQVRADCR